MLSAFLWMGQLHGFWREQLGDRYWRRYARSSPNLDRRSDAAAATRGRFPSLGIHDWHEMARFSQKQRELVLKIIGYTEHAWGSRGVYVGHDLPATNGRKPSRRR